VKKNPLLAKDEKKVHLRFTVGSNSVRLDPRYGVLYFYIILNTIHFTVLNMNAILYLPYYRTNCFNNYCLFISSI